MIGCALAYRAPSLKGHQQKYCLFFSFSFFPKTSLYSPIDFPLISFLSSTCIFFCFETIYLYLFTWAVFLAILILESLRPTKDHYIYQSYIYIETLKFIHEWNNLVQPLTFWSIGPTMVIWSQVSEVYMSNHIYS